MKKLILLLLLPTLCLAQKKAKNHKNQDYLVTVTTDLGVMNIILYDQTPQHKANFIKLVDQKFYDGLLFHRVIQNFMVQGGDPNSRAAKATDGLGTGDVGYTIPAEFVPTLFHKKGALAAARNDNPEKASSGCQFYIVDGRVWDNEGLEKQIERIKLLNGRLPMEDQKQVYKTLGGTPHLDGNYTVFGEVIYPPAKAEKTDRKKSKKSPVSVTKPTVQVAAPTGDVGTPTGSIGVPGGKINLPTAKVRVPTAKVDKSKKKDRKSNQKPDKSARKITGLAVIDSIASQPRNPADRPLQDVRMTVTGKWEKKKKITKQFGYKFL